VTRRAPGARLRVTITPARGETHVNRAVRRCLAAPGVLIWRFFTGKPLDGVPRTDAGFFTRGHKTLGPGTAPRPPAALGAEIRTGITEAREEWRDLVAEIREHRQLIRRMHQLITGKAAPTRQEVRQAERAILAEVEELQEIARRIIAEHGQEDFGQ